MNKVMIIFKTQRGGKSMSDKINDSDGSFSIIQGVVNITDPKQNGAHAILFVKEDKRLKVTVDEVEVSGEVSLSASSKINIVLLNAVLQQPAEKLSTVVSEDKMSLRIKKEITPGKHLVVADMAPTSYAHLTFSIEAFPPPPSLASDLEYLVNSEDYVGVFDYEALDTLAASQINIELIVLNGKQPYQGRPGYYRQTFEVEEINVIEKGILVAVYEEEEKAVFGINVYGADVPIFVQQNPTFIGDGILREKNGNLFSSRSGRLVFNEKEIQVMPQIIVSRDLLQSDGELIFRDGDIIIKGNITEHCVVKAGGSVIVEGGIFESTVSGDHGVSAGGNISNSHITAGSKLISYKIVKSLILEIINDLSSTKDTCLLVIEKAIAQKEDKDTIQLLINQIIRETHPALNRNWVSLKKLKEEDEQLKLDEPLEKITAYINTINDAAKKRIPTYLEISNSLPLFLDYNKKLNLLLSEKVSNITAVSLTNSNVQTSGSIEITKNGSYLSTLTCENKITIKGSVKGGFLFAENFIEVDEYQTYNLSDRGLEVRNPDGIIKMGTRYPDTKVKIGAFEHRNNDFEYKVNLLGEAGIKNKLR
jgi:hypothetical protein